MQTCQNRHLMSDYKTDWFNIYKNDIILKRDIILNFIYLQFISPMLGLASMYNQLKMQNNSCWTSKRIGPKFVSENSKNL